MERGRAFEIVLVLLLLLFGALLCIAVTSAAPQAPDQWSLSSVSPTAYTFAGDGGMVYLFDGNDIYAVHDGNLLWKYEVPLHRSGWIHGLHQL